jgi:adenosylmethionine-8-amino-7-oxononanoate aminotransferase
MTSTALTEALLRNDLDAYWMPFTANRAFKQSPRLLAYAEGMHYFRAAPSSTAARAFGAPTPDIAALLSSRP